MTQTAEESRAYQRDDGMWVFPREEFASQRVEIRKDHHVVFAGPTRKGKTQLAFKLLEYTATPDRPAYVAVSKPEDPVSAAEGKRLGYRRIPDFPPDPKIREMFREGKPSGYLIWPDMRKPETSASNAADVTRRLINAAYTDGAKRKPSILVLDDTPTKSMILGIDHEMVMVATMGGAMGVTGWYFVQKPTGAGKAAIWAYGAAEHVFITRDPDKRNRERYREIGGIDVGRVDQISMTLQPYQFLYLERTHGYMCIVDAK